MRSRKILAALLCALLLFASMTSAAYALAPIQTDEPVRLTVSFMDGTLPLPGSEFRLYKVADTEEDLTMTLDWQFKPYASTVENLQHLTELSAEDWTVLAYTLESYVLLDGLTPEKTGVTDENGAIVMDDLEPGLYLLTGTRTQVGNKYYDPIPNMIFLPAIAEDGENWNYDVTVNPKYEVTELPPAETVNRKVIKVWEDEGYENLRPEGIWVQLLCDGEEYDAEDARVMLCPANFWSYEWTDLPAEHVWRVVETDTAGYRVSVTQSGITTIITNYYVVEPSEVDIPIFKVLKGDKPKNPATFTFVMNALDESYPVPEGYEAGKSIVITGAGSASFGTLSFDEPGTYSYCIFEINDGLEGYTYDETVYLLTFEVTEVDGELVVSTNIQTDAGKTAEKVEFVNSYLELPNTGVLWWPVPILCALGIGCLILGTVLKRRREE